MNETDEQLCKWREILGMGMHVPSQYGLEYPTYTTTTPKTTVGGTAYVTSSDECTLYTKDGTIVKINAKENIITIDDYTIKIDTIKNAIQKIQEEQKYV